MSLYELFFGFTPETKARHPELLQPNRHIDRHNGKRIVPMQVLSLGMSRTGTSSMQAALEILLDSPCYHGFTLLSSLSDANMFWEAYASKYYSDDNNNSTARQPLDRTFWDKLFGHVAAITDLPAVNFAPELIAAYPEAKVVLVERDIESWYESFNRHIITSAYTNPIFRCIARLEPARTGRWWRLLVDGVARDSCGASNAVEFRAQAREMYRRHYAEIRWLMQAQPERLLEYRLGSGWEPLCAFLGRPVPEGVPFPRVNEAEMMREKMRLLLWMCLRNAAQRARVVLVPAVVIAGAVVAWLWNPYAWACVQIASGQERPVTTSLWLWPWVLF